jgi:hypothetical protein
MKVKINEIEVSWKGTLEGNNILQSYKETIIFKITF